VTREGVFAPELRPTEIQICRKELRPTASRCYKQFSPKHLSRAPSLSSLRIGGALCRHRKRPRRDSGRERPPTQTTKAARSPSTGGRSRPADSVSQRLGGGRSRRKTGKDLTLQCVQKNRQRPRAARAGLSLESSRGSRSRLNIARCGGSSRRRAFATPPEQIAAVNTDGGRPSPDGRTAARSFGL
jgi:hypothetical protein